MKKKTEDIITIVDNAYLVNQKLRTSVVEFVAKLAASEDKHRPVHHRKNAKRP